MDPVLYRTPVLDANGRMTREWIRFFSQLDTASGTVQNIQNTTVIQGQASAFDDLTQHDIASEIVNALMQVGDTPQPVNRDITVEFGEVPRVLDPLTGLTFTDTPQHSQGDPLAALQFTDTPNFGRAEDLSALLLMCDGPQLTNGATGTFTSADSKTITVVNGIITAIV